jgi:hypothetical protein
MVLIRINSEQIVGKTNLITNGGTEFRFVFPSRATMKVSKVQGFEK